MSYEFRGMEIPSHMVDALNEYVTTGRKPGHFLSAVIANDLSAAVAHADGSNIHIIPAYVGWLYNEAPGSCWGDWERFEAWEGMKSLTDA